jgi:hypothetical protein
LSYTAEISRANPTCVVFLIDQSLSMSDPIGGAAVPMRKADAVAEAINSFLSELCVKCAKEDGVRDYFHVAVIGYGAEVGPAFRGRLAGRWLVPLSEVAAAPYRLEERVPAPAGAAVGTAAGLGGRAAAPALAERPVRVPVWFEPTAFGDTPMRAALAGAHAIVREWLAVHPGCFPPIVLNITDGESTDGDPAPVAADVRELVSADGPALLFNLHLSEDRSDPVAFPAENVRLPDDFAAKLFSMSSRLPEHMRAMARQQGLALDPGARGFVFNADASSVVRFLNIGTQVLNVR